MTFFGLSSSSSDWMSGSLQEIQKKRQAVYENFCRNHHDQLLLTFEEEVSLLRFYENALRDFCRSFGPMSVPPDVTATSLVYFKRFYLKESVMAFDPKSILVTSVFLAMKVLEFNVSMSVFVSNVKGDRKRAVDVILGHELLVMSRLDFRLRIHTPFKAVDGLFLMMMMANNANMKTNSTINSMKKRALNILEKQVLLTDACLLFSPSQVS